GPRGAVPLAGGGGWPTASSAGRSGGWNVVRRRRALPPGGRWSPTRGAAWRQSARGAHEADDPRCHSISAAIVQRCTARRPWAVGRRGTLIAQRIAHFSRPPTRESAPLLRSDVAPVARAAGSFGRQRGRGLHRPGGNDRG